MSGACGDIMEGFLKIVQEETQINSHDMFGFFPESFYADEILFFSVAPTFFFGTDAHLPKNELICINALQLYVSIKVHILARRNVPVAHPNALELAVLSGDYLSGRFTERTVKEGEIELFYSWLDYSLKVYEDLTKLSLQGSSEESRHCLHVEALMKQLFAFAGQKPEKERIKGLAQDFRDGSWEEYNKMDAALKIGHPRAIGKLAKLTAVGGHRKVAGFQELEGIHTIWVDL